MNITLITNSHGSEQPSMIGYGRLLHDQMSLADFKCNDLQVTGFFDGKSKYLRNIDRFFLSPIAFVGHSSEICHVIDPSNAFYLPFTRSKKKSITIHDAIPYLAEAGELDGFKPSRMGSKLMSFLESQFKKCDGIVTVSENTKNDICRLFNINEENIKVIRNSITQNLSAGSIDQLDEFRKNYDLLIDKPLIMHIGKNFYKNRSGVIDVMDHLHRRGFDSHLVMVSPADESLISQIQTCGISSRVTFLSNLSEVELSYLYQISDVLLFPSIYEGFGLPVLEAQKLGTPVICSGEGSLKEVAGEGAIIEKYYDVEGLADSVIACITQDALAQDLINKGFQNIKRFSLDIWRDSYTSFFKDLTK
jgi:glycosyltransferase involved in cell wall biosynthesis